MVHEVRVSHPAQGHDALSKHKETHSGGKKTFFTAEKTSFLEDIRVCKCINVNIFIFYAGFKCNVSQNAAD